jgi:hypothetical protein
MTTPPRPTQAELLEELQRTVLQPQAALELSAVQTAGLFAEGVPEDVAADALGELAPDRDGWSVDARRAWKLQAVPGVLVLVRPGRSLEDVLAQLDRVRAELVARPELLSADWEKPLTHRPTLRLVKGRGEGG